ncbi:MAG: hypothetical protein COA58_15935 [Bacteroidetes bacterium]|nr:MAG: hypothetical protein COA58_15935 [Bacteroidota bacterium]
MIAKLENGSYNVYNEDGLLIGGIKTQSNFNTTEFSIDGETFKLSRNKWDTKVFKDEKIIYNLKTNSFSGNTELLETGQKITGVTGFKWGTKMVDKENNTLLKIRNKNKFINTNQYVIEISNPNATDFDILLTLYGHIHGSNMKLKVVILSIIVAGIIAGRVLIQ